MKFMMEIKQGAISFDVEYSIASLLVIMKILYRAGKNTSQRAFMGFNTINIHCKVISGNL